LRFLGLAFLLAIVLMVVLVLYISGQEPALGKGMNIVDSIVEGPASSDPTPVKFNVYPGDSAATIAQRLERERIIKNSWSNCYGDSGYAYLPYDWVRAYGMSAVVLGDVN